MCKINTVIFFKGFIRDFSTIILEVTQLIVFRFIALMIHESQGPVFMRKASEHSDVKVLLIADMDLKGKERELQIMGREGPRKSRNTWDRWGSSGPLAAVRNKLPSIWGYNYTDSFTVKSRQGVWVSHKFVWVNRERGHNYKKKTTFLIITC